MIYLVEDDAGIRELMSYTLMASGFQTRGFDRGEALWQALEKEVPRLILLDIMLPGEDGLSLLRFLRENHRTAETPVIMLTAKGTEMDKVQGLDYGADDYMVKPFGMAELVARIRARLRRTAPKPDAGLLTYGSLTLDRRAHKASVDGVELPLTLKEYDLLLLLMENSGAAFTREQLLEQVWDIAYDGGTRTVDVHIQTLRTKLGPCSSMIETVRGVGYRFGGGQS